jgi:gamma-butyrobetaine dioxygenase
VSQPAVTDPGAAGHRLLRGFAAAWLRANCPCALCRDPGSGQRLVSITDLPAEVTIDAATVSGGDVSITFGPDGHRAVLSAEWLAGQAAPGTDERTEDAKRLWTAGDFPAGPPAWTWQAYLADPAVRADCLATLLRDGMAVLREVPPEPGTVLTVAESMGYVRETNYGRLFDVRVTATPSNLAFTGLPIAPHTDNPYRDPVPTVQLLHCLETAVEGGDSGLVDGFAVAAALRREHPAAFGVLTTTPVTFAYADATASLRATRPMIGLDPAGRIREIRFNNRSLQPWRPPAGATGEAGTVAAGAAFYAAYRTFAELLAQPQFLLYFQLRPGDCMVFDNTRVLHARTGFAATGSRHLQGCYADLDGVGSELAVWQRQTPKAQEKQENQP